jgi:3-hydroxyacyl-[acyl-carrier-protein] dehydratase
MNREEIKEILPHREPMLLVDESEFDGEYVNASYTVKGDEFFLQGHFPENPVVPGVILCEIMAQCSVLLVAEQVKGHLTFYAGLDGVRFKKAVVPGDKVCVKSHLTAVHWPLFCVEAEARVDSKLCCKAKMEFMVR